jgi:hypothetical protein
LPKYNKIDNIPAKVFFEILKTKNYQLLKPKPSEKDLEVIFVSIYDEFFIQSDNAEAKRYLELTKSIAFLRYKIAIIKQTLHFCYYNKTTKEMRLELIEALKNGCDIDIDKDANFGEEVIRVLNVEIGIIENDLTIETDELEAMIKSSQNKDFDYFENICSLSGVLENNSLLKEDMTLAVYVALEKLAKRKVEQSKIKK